ncbi:chemotaxis protein CheW [Roseospira marina]|uniref:Chemotaxis protein CheW n=1 Tax=Roseospira marina TaxID=140057 RepID=A0A5M6IA84_9PROT|nr:chemotaxis protein CheW [Roseospira marina]KAA5604588.1 chemotaxis protein CheW [Roseospira marina]MBB4315338.1 purine-binding chemotaxis protein CheW [Roseospira marina]MBB5088337.1 purine-binding chemotaxis protein CheW [Roseospira marina]
MTHAAPTPVSAPGPSLAAHGAADSETHTVLSMALAGTVFALETAIVLEVLDVVPLSPVPNGGAFVKGLLNVRGKVVPVVELRARLGLTTESERTVDSRIVVLSVPMDGEDTLVGIMADKVHGVVDIDTARLSDPPAVGISWRAEFVKSISRRDDGFIVILDVEKVFGVDGDTGR